MLKVKQLKFLHAEIENKIAGDCSLLCVEHLVLCKTPLVFLRNVVSPKLQQPDNSLFRCQCVL